MNRGTLRFRSTPAVASRGCGLCVALTLWLLSASSSAGPARTAQLYAPLGLATDAAGGLMIADTANHRIRGVDASGWITTAAGAGTCGFSGDGGLATGAQLCNAMSVAVDSMGNVYIADTWNDRIRKIDGSGVISTFAGAGEGGFSGDGAAATDAMLDAPGDVATDEDGNVFIADTNNRRIRKVDPNGIITTVAGSSIQEDFVSASTDPIVREIGDGGPATNANLSYPIGIAVGSNDDLYISDQGHSRIRRVDAEGIITTFAGNGYPGGGNVPLALGDGGPSTSASLNYPGDIALDARGNLYIADRYNYRVRKVDAFSKIITTVAGNGAPYPLTEILPLGDGGSATDATLAFPAGVAVDPSGNLYISEYDGNRVRKVDVNGVISTWAGTGDPGSSGDE